MIFCRIKYWCGLWVFFDYDTSVCHSYNYNALTKVCNNKPDVFGIQLTPTLVTDCGRNTIHPTCTRWRFLGYMEYFELPALAAPQNSDTNTHRKINVKSRSISTQYAYSSLFLFLSW